MKAILINYFIYLIGVVVFMSIVRKIVERKIKRRSKWRKR